MTHAAGSRGLRRVVTAAVAGAVVGALSLVVGVPAIAPMKGAGIVAAGGLGLAAGALFGAFELLLVRLAGARASRIFERIRPFIDASAGAPREPVVALHVWASLAVIACIAIAGSTKLAMMRLRSVQNLELQETLTILCVVGGVVGAMVVVAFARSRVERVVQAIDGRRRLPLPSSPALRATIWVGLPSFVVGGAAVALLGRTLGPYVAPFAVLALLGVQVALLAVLDRFVPSTSQSHRIWTAATVVGLFVVGLGATHAAVTVSVGAGAVLDQAPWPAAMVRAARAATDVDLDGASSLFGGKDCAPLSSKRRPGATDLPGNGIDEDCNGADSTAKVAIPGGPRLAKPAAAKKRDIVWFIADALRADHTSAGRYKRPTMPAVDRLAKESLVFTQAYSQSSATMLSFPSFLTGIDPGRLMWRVEKQRLQLGRGQPTIAERLGDMGYRTGFVAGGYFKIRLPGLTENWSWVGYSDRNQTQSSASAASLAASFITRAQEGPEPFLLVVYLPAPHSPYVHHGAGYPEFGKKPVDLYDSELNNADRYIGFMLDLLRENEQRWKDTVVVVTGDHGEEFGEHGGSEHATTCHTEVTHVPIFLRVPGAEPRRVDRRVALVDLVPTMIDLVGGSLEDDEIDGHSLLLAANDEDAVAADRPIFCSVVSQKATQGSFFNRGVRSGKWFANKELRSGGGVVLYDTSSDPGEKTPVALEGEAAAVAKNLESWLDSQLTSNLGEIPLGGDM